MHGIDSPVHPLHPRQSYHVLPTRLKGLIHTLAAIRDGRQRALGRRDVALQALGKSHLLLLVQEEMVVAPVQGLAQVLDVALREECLPRLPAGLALAALEGEQQGVEAGRELWDGEARGLALGTVQVLELRRVVLRRVRG